MPVDDVAVTLGMATGSFLRCCSWLVVAPWGKGRLCRTMRVSGKKHLVPSPSHNFTWRSERPSYPGSVPEILPSCETCSADAEMLPDKQDDAQWVSVVIKAPSNPNPSMTSAAKPRMGLIASNMAQPHLHSSWNLCRQQRRRAEENQAGYCTSKIAFQNSTYLLRAFSSLHQQPNREDFIFVTVNVLLCKFKQC